ncbi:MAG: signal peptidase I [Verrucomicrobiales bacterium]|nr:signal peptidase I [Verrucomicrobiales bacterium]
MADNLKLTAVDAPPPLPRRKTQNRAWLVLGIVIAAPFIIWTILSITGVVKNYQIPSSAMSPAINPGDMIYVEKITYWFRPPERNEIIAFEVNEILDMQDHFPTTIYTFRVVGLPGDEISIDNDQLLVNGEPCQLTPEPNPVAFQHQAKYPSSAKNLYTVPEGSYFVLGDNLGNSNDSRMWGSVHKRHLRGKIWFRYWPPDRFGAVE